MQAAADYLLGSDVQAEEVADLTPFSDATVRAATRKLGVPARRRGPQRKQESNPESEIATTPAPTTQPPFTSSSLPVDSRVADLLGLATDLTPAKQAEAAERIRTRHSLWLRGLRPQPATDAELIDRACRANVATYSDLRP